MSYIIYPIISEKDFKHKKKFLKLLKKVGTVLKMTSKQERKKFLKAGDEKGGKFVIDNLLRDKMKPSNKKGDYVAIFLLDKETHTDKWVRYEIYSAKSLCIPRLGLKISEDAEIGLLYVKCFAEWDAEKIKKRIKEITPRYCEKSVSKDC